MFMLQIRKEIESAADHPLLHNSINMRARIYELPTEILALLKLMNFSKDI